MVRPSGPVRVRKTRAISRDVRVAELSGAKRGVLAAVRRGSRYFVAGSAKLGGIREVPADTLTDALHHEVRRLGRKASAGKKGRKS